MKKGGDGHYYFCQTYGVHVFYYLGWSWEDFCKKMNIDPNPREGIVGYTMFNSDDAVMWIFTAKKTDYAILAHECLHAANQILFRAGWKPQLTNDEPQAYLLTQLMRSALAK